MRAKIGNKMVEVWKISHQPISESWVSQSFEKKIIKLAPNLSRRPVGQCALVCQYR